MRAASDAALGTVLLTAGAVALVTLAGMDLGRVSRPGPGFFPTAIGWVLLLAGVAELLRAVLLREREDKHWSLKGAAIMTVVSLCALLAAWWSNGNFGLRLDAPEWAALLALVLSVMIALARLSRLRAAGMVFLGLLLGTVGTHVNTGVQRLMFGFDSLADGLSLHAALLGFVIADAALCVVSPSLLFTVYARKVGRRFTARPVAPDSLLRAAGGLVIAGGLYAGNILEDTELIGQIALFGALGLACQLLGWNRLILFVALLIGPLLEENIERAALLSRDDPTFLLTRPIGGTMLLAAVAILTSAIALSAWRTRVPAQPGGAAKQAGAAKPE